jgi:hypothetical protein
MEEHGGFADFLPDLKSRPLLTALSSLNLQGDGRTKLVAQCNFTIFCSTLADFQFLLSFLRQVQNLHICEEIT